MAGPQTAREALIAELIGDVDALIGRAEALHSALPDAAEKAASRVAGAGQNAADDIIQAATALRRELTAEGDTLLKGLQGATKEAQNAARVVDKSARRFGLMALLLGLAGGVIGGCLAGYALALHLLG